MSMLKTCALNLCLAAGMAGVAQGQIYKLHNADVGVAATGQFITTLTTDAAPVQKTTWSPGFIATLREHPVAWAGIEFNYGFTRYSQRFSYPVAGSTALVNFNQPNSVHEFTAAYLFHPHFRHLQPFVGIGGGYQLFNPNTGQNQWRETGLLETGLDIPTSNPHFGFRVQGRALVNRAPNFYNSAISSRSWVVNTQPSAGAWIRF